MNCFDNEQNQRHTHTLTYAHFSNVVTHFRKQNLHQNWTNGIRVMDHRGCAGVAIEHRCLFVCMRICVNMSHNKIMALIMKASQSFTAATSSHSVFRILTTNRSTEADLLYALPFCRLAHTLALSLGRFVPTSVSESGHTFGCATCDSGSDSNS